jgi:hypothetical protein
MPFDSVPGHHKINNLQTFQNRVPFRFIPIHMVRWDTPLA